MSARNAKYFDSDTDWQTFADKHGYQLRARPYPNHPLDVIGDREAQLVSEGEWATSHPLKKVGYETHLEYPQVSDGYRCEIKVYRSTRASKDARLPLLFVTHGGGWVQGTYVTEEAWLLWPLFSHLDLVIVSVNYRRAPEHTFPTLVNDCWDVLSSVTNRSDELRFDASKVILAGSSAGGCLAAILSQKARTAQLPIAGVLLNVPITCDPRHFPKDKYEYTSYDQCFGTLLGSFEMKEIWKVVVESDEAGRNPSPSPLLGDVEGLPFHALYVAGQDPLRDEGIAYGEKLKANGVSVRMHIYQGVPHTFGEFWELATTQQFWKDLRVDIQTIISQ